MPLPQDGELLHDRPIPAESQEREESASLGTVPTYARTLLLCRRGVQWLKKRYPNLVDHSGQFIGATTTNAMEGGNHRLKYELRADYINDESAEARCILMAIRDSTKTFRHGHPEQSFAAMNSGFEYCKLMGAAMDGTERTISMMAMAA